MSRSLTINGPDARAPRHGVPHLTLLHGSAASPSQWDALVAHLPASWQVLVPRLAGYADPEFDFAAPYDVQVEVERIAVPPPGSGPRVLVGHSMGGLVAAATCLAHPGRYSALVLVEAVLFGLLAKPGFSAVQHDVRSYLRYFMSLQDPARQLDAARAMFHFWKLYEAWEAQSPARRELAAACMRKVRLECRLFDDPAVQPRVPCQRTGGAAGATGEPTPDPPPGGSLMTVPSHPLAFQRRSTMSTSNRNHRPLRRLRRRLLAAGMATALAMSPAFAGNDSPWCGDRCDQVVLDWNQAAHQVIKAADGYANPLTASRALAMTHLAMHDAANAITPRYASYALDDEHIGRRAGARGADEAAAAVAASAAAHDLLLALYPTQGDLLRATLDESLHDAGVGVTVTAAVATGKRAAAAVLAKRANDGSQGAEDYREGSAPGNYRFVPGTDFILMPHWRHVQPFALRAPDQFRVAPPPALGSAEYTQAFEEVKTGGSDAPNAVRTPDQAHYAAFWYEFSDAGWNRVARVVARDHDQDLWERARTFALLNVALADSYIAGWDSKLHYDFWRPVTAIREAALDGNPATRPDTGWNSFLPTPPIQDHPSTHSALGAAAATVLAHAFGRDALQFSFTSPTALPANPQRSFTSFSQAARENADSRVRAGLHFRFATTQGLLLGQRIGAHAVDTLLTPRY